MIFEEVLKAVISREAIAFRSNWEEDRFIFCQIPANIPANIIPNMQSLPDIVKNEILININGNITYYAPSEEDLIALDWKIISDMIPC